MQKKWFPNRQCRLKLPFAAGFRRSRPATTHSGHSGHSGERFETMQQSRVHCNLSIGHAVVCHRSPRGLLLRCSAQKNCPNKTSLVEHLRVMNAGSDENFVAEPAEFREL